MSYESNVHCKPLPKLFGVAQESLTDLFMWFLTSYDSLLVMSMD